MTQQTRPLVSIGIPTYNRANGHLHAAVQSAAEQTYPNIEIIVSDNCSTDHTEHLIKSFEYPRIRYFKQETNIGLNNNWNFCLEQAGGDYFLLLHDDDLIDADFIEACMTAVNDDTSVGIIRTGTRSIDDDGNVRGEGPNLAGGLSTRDFFLAWLERRSGPHNICSTLYNTRALKDIGGFWSKTNLYQAEVAAAKLAASHGRADVKTVKASFRKHTGTYGSAARISDWCDDSLYLLEVMCSLVPTEREALWRTGMRYFSRANYNRASRTKPASQRFKAYLTVYRKFQYSFSPLEFMYFRLSRRLKHRGKHRVTATSV